MAKNGLEMNPYLDNESAVLWLNYYVARKGIDRKVLYHLNLTPNLIENG